MGIRINTNLDALTAQRNLASTGLSFSRAVSRLSSGLRITKAADDAAGLSISQKLSSQSRGLLQAARNSQDGISLIQTAEGAMGEIHSVLQRMRELSVQAANTASMSDSDAAAVRLEIVQLRSEIDRIGDNTEFNGKVLLDGTAGVTVDTSGAIADGKSVGTLTAVYTDIEVGGADASARYTLAGAGGRVTMSGTVGGTIVSQGITNTGLTNSSQTFNFTSFGLSFRVLGTSTGATLTSTNMNGDNLLTSANSALTLHVGANEAQTIGLSLNSIKTDTIGKTVGANANLGAIVDATTTGALMKTNADDFITMIDDAIQDISDERATLGAIQNRLDHTINNLNIAAENMRASESRITDADIALETVGFIRAQILQQAGVAVLAQANQTPQTVLALLR